MEIILKLVLKWRFAAGDWQTMKHTHTIHWRKQRNPATKQDKVLGHHLQDLGEEQTRHPKSGGAEVLVFHLSWKTEQKVHLENLSIL